MDAMPGRPARRAFTLVELLVVVTIIALISAVALPVVLPALSERRVSEASRLLQAVLSGARDAAIRANAPRGIRLLPDPVFNPNGTGPPGTLASNRVVAIEPAPDYTEGQVTVATRPLKTNTGTVTQLIVQEVLFTNPPTNTIPGAPTSWYWNIRQGDKIRFNGSGNYYTIAGPMTIGPNADAKAQANGQMSNTDRFINNGPPNTNFTNRPAEFLIVTNGIDDDNDGFVDNSFDGLDNDGDGIIDPLFNGLDDDKDGIIDNETTGKENEPEQFVGSQSSPFPTSATNPAQQVSYTIYRRPVVSPTAREVALPDGIVIDLTTWNAPTANLTSTTSPVLLPERSRLPVDPYTKYVDIMISPNGQVVQAGAGGANGDYNANSPMASQPFYHFWLTDREDVQPPLFGFQSYTNKSNTTLTDIPALNPKGGTAAGSLNYLLPMPKGTPNYAGSIFLTGERRLVTVFVKTGQILTNSIQSFNGYDANAPFYDAQSGIKESQ